MSAPIRVPVIVLGLGGVGRALVRQIVAARDVHARRFGLRLDVVAMADSNATIVASPPVGARHAVPLHDGQAGVRDSGPMHDGQAGVRDSGPMHDGQLLACAEAKAAGRTFVAVAGGIVEGVDVVDDEAALAGVSHAIVVDCTAADAVTPRLRAALERGWDIVLANKLPLVGSLDDFAFLTGNGVDAGEAVVPGRRGRARWEATVGAGVPLIATLARLVAAGDAVARIEGTFSGTLNFVATELRGGRPLSAIVRDAMDRGFTEPDPRTDLGGHDMARKALILARMLGWRLELGDVAVEGLYSPEWDRTAVADDNAPINAPTMVGARHAVPSPGTPAAAARPEVDAFLRRLPSLDAPTAARVAAAEAAGGVYRVVASVADGHASVAPTIVPADGPLGRLTGTDNLVAFHTRWYDAAPLVLQGRGAGVEATGSGVLADVVELAMMRRQWRTRDGDRLR